MPSKLLFAALIIVHLVSAVLALMTTKRKKPKPKLDNMNTIFIIFGIIVGSVLFIFIVVAIYILCCVMSSSKPKKSPQKKAVKTQTTKAKKTTTKERKIESKRKAMPTIVNDDEEKVIEGIRRAEKEKKQSELKSQCEHMIEMPTTQEGNDGNDSFKERLLKLKRMRRNRQQNVKQQTEGTEDDDIMKGSVRKKIEKAKKKHRQTKKRPKPEQQIEGNQLSQQSAAARELLFPTLVYSREGIASQVQQQTQPSRVSNQKSTATAVGSDERMRQLLSGVSYVGKAHTNRRNNNDENDDNDDKVESLLRDNLT